MTHDSRSVLVIRDSDLIGRGNGRACYAHPEDPGLCLKVSLNPRGTRESVRERQYLRRAVQRYGDDLHRHVARLHGKVCTDRGDAWVAERVSDESSGRSSSLLRDALTPEALAQDPGGWQRAFDDFMTWTSDAPIVFRDWSSTNLCAQRLADGGWRLVVIDGFAPKELLLRWFPSRLHARERNRHYALRAGMHSLETLASLCRHERRGPDAHVASVTSSGAS